MENTKICDTLIYYTFNKSQNNFTKGELIKSFLRQCICFSMLFIVTTFTAKAQKEKSQFNFVKEKHFLYVNSLIGFSLYDINDFNGSSIFPELGVAFGSQIYFNEKENSFKIGLDLEYLNYSASHFIHTGMALSLLKPGLVISKVFSNNQSGIDFKVNIGGIVSGTKEDHHLGSGELRSSFGWAGSTSIQLVKKRFIYGIYYQFAQLFTDGLQFHHRIDLSLGIRF